MSPVVLDTCALISGLLSPRGYSGALVAAFFDNRLILAYTPEILAEYAEVMERPHLHIEPNERIAIILKLRSNGNLTKPAPVPEDNWPDKDDLPFVGAALATTAKIIITLNPRDFAPAKTHGLRILNPSQALNLIR